MKLYAPAGAIRLLTCGEPGHLPALPGKALGDRSCWPEIARLNGIAAENPHRAEQYLELPG